ncbi:degenerate transposase [Streptococcus pneumoniae]|nr:degenerate transposase [Streptococcus pneumoniae]
MYQDEAGFGRISKLGSCWSPIGVGPHVHSHYIREFRYCYGAVDAYTGESFFLIAGGCNTEWMNAFLEELSQAYPDDYLLLVMDNAIWHKSSTLKIPTNIGFAAHPYASWERGTNENHNRLIRRWLPKGTKKMTPKEVAFIEKWINNYPKKCLDYKSPREDFWMANLNLKFSKMEIIFIKRFQ